MTWIFWSSVLFVAYAYAGYPACLLVLSLARRRSLVRAPITPTVSVIITAHNEEARLPEKLANTLSQDYPRDRLEVLVASDCSTDRTDVIARSQAASSVKLVRAGERRGKENAQRLAVAEASGEILVFSDVATRMDSDGIRRIVMSFADPSVGCVSSVDRMLDSEGRPTGEGGYVRYEMRLRQLETNVGSVVGLSGSFFAARREVCTPWPTHVPSDFTIVFNAVRRGLRAVSDPFTIGYYKDLADPAREYARKVRTVVRGLSGLLTHRALLNPFRYGLFSWQLFSHKLCRWLVPFAMVAALAANLALAASPGVYRLLAFCHLAGYVLAVLALNREWAWLRLMRPAGYLVLANASILNAWLRIARGQQYVLWTPSKR